MSDMSPELIGIISVGASQAVLIMGLFAWLRQDMKGQGKEIKELHKKITEQGQKHSDEITEVKSRSCLPQSHCGNLLPGPGGPTPNCSRGGAPRGLRRGLISLQPGSGRTMHTSRPPP